MFVCQIHDQFKNKEGPEMGGLTEKTSRFCLCIFFNFCWQFQHHWGRATTWWRHHYDFIFPNSSQYVVKNLLTFSDNWWHFMLILLYTIYACVYLRYWLFTFRTWLEFAAALVRMLKTRRCSQKRMGALSKENDYAEKKICLLIQSLISFFLLKRDLKRKRSYTVIDFQIDVHYIR